MQINQERLKERIERINEMSRDETGGSMRMIQEEVKKSYGRLI